MKLGIISDTHIPEKSQHVPKAALDAFKKVDMVLHAGDMVSLEAIDEIKAVCPKVMAVSGNMDPESLRKKFPQKQLFEIAGFKVGLMHGNGAPVNLVNFLKDAFKADKPDLIIFGHSHKAFNEVIDGIRFFNPGSASDFPGSASIGIIEISKKINAKIIKI